MFADAICNDTMDVCERIENVNPRDDDCHRMEMWEEFSNSWGMRGEAARPLFADVDSDGTYSELDILYIVQLPLRCKQIAAPKSKHPSPFSRACVYVAKFTLPGDNDLVVRAYQHLHYYRR